MRSRRTSRAAVVVTAAAAATAVATAAWAYYAITSTSSNAVVTGASLGTPAAGTPTASATSVAFTVGLPATGVTPTGYRVDRTAPSAVAGVCTFATSAGGTCTDSSPVAGQTNTYAAYALLGAWQSLTPATVSASVPAAGPSVAVTFPSAGVYNAAGWTAGCSTVSTDDLCGTSSGAASVSVSIRQGTGSYWSNATSSFSSASEVLLSATGTSTWSLAFAGTRFTSGQSYTIRAVAGTASASRTFTWDTTAPTATNAVSTDVAGTAGKIEATDKLTLTYSEAIDPASIVTGWTGTAMNVVVRGTNGASTDSLTVFNAANTTQIPVGSVDLGDGGFFTANVTYGATGTASTMAMTNGVLTITLGTVSDATKLGTLGASNQKSKLTWTPSTTAKDLAGNACSATAFLATNATQF